VSQENWTFAVRFQLHVPFADAGLPDPLPAPDAVRALEAMATALSRAGIGSRREQDEATVGPDDLEWAALTPEEQAEGGYTYEGLIVEGPCWLSVTALRTELFVSADLGDAEQAGVSHLMRALHSLAPLLPVPEEDRAAITERAAAWAVAPDGTITRSILSRKELTDRAIALFDRVHAPELVRPWAEELVARHGEAVRRSALAHPAPFAAYRACSPGNRSARVVTPDRDGDPRDRFRHLTDAMRDLLRLAADEPWEATGIPSGIRVVRTADDEVAVHLTFDNILDAGAVDPAQLQDRYRSAPFAWEGVALGAAERDPRFQPGWLPAAVELLAAGGVDVTVNTVHLVPDDAVPTQTRDIRLPLHVPAESAPVARPLRPVSVAPPAPAPAPAPPTVPASAAPPAPAPQAPPPPAPGTADSIPFAETLTRHQVFQRGGHEELAHALQSFIASRARVSAPGNNPVTVHVSATYLADGTFSFATDHAHAHEGLLSYPTDAQIARAFVFLHELDGQVGRMWRRATVTCLIGGSYQFESHSWD
jgi:hypothetical protein